MITILREGSGAANDVAAQGRRIKQLEEQLQQMRDAAVCALNQMLELKDLNTGVHSTRLAEWALRVAEQLGVSEQQFRDIEAAAILHDIGKVGVPDAILNKPGRLTPEEREVINKHSEYGWAIIDRKSTRLNSSHVRISYAVFCLKKKKEDVQCLLRPGQASERAGAARRGRRGAGRLGEESPERAPVQLPTPCIVRQSKWRQETCP